MRPLPSRPWAAGRFILGFLAFASLLQLGQSLSMPKPTANNRASTIKVVYAGYPDKYPEYRECLQEAFQELELDNISLTDDLEANDPSEVDYIIYNPKGLLQDFTPYANTTKAVFNLQAGADAVANNPTLPHSIPLTRMVDPGLREGMVEYVVGHVLRYHLAMDSLWDTKSNGQWNSNSGTPVLARQRTVGILGLGELGGSCADALVALNFNVYGWSRAEKERVGISCCHGTSGLDLILAESDILVLLLPNTPETENLMNQQTIAKCKLGVCLVNAGRGSSINDDDLLKALEDGRVAGATLDVFRIEPLPSDHAYWKHPNVLITPHIAAKSRPVTAAQVIAQNILRAETGKPLLYLVDRDAGY